MGWVALTARKGDCGNASNDTHPSIFGWGTGVFTMTMLARNSYTKVPASPTHFYVYYYKDGRYLFERTCGTERSAEDRVKELKSRGYKAVYLIDYLIQGAFH